MRSMTVLMAEKVEERKRSGESYRTIAERSGLTHTTIANIHKLMLRREPNLETIIKFWRGMGLSDHEVGHLIMGLGPPGETGEAAEFPSDKKQLLLFFESLNGPNRNELLTYASGLSRGQQSRKKVTGGE